MSTKWTSDVAPLGLGPSVDPEDWRIANPIPPNVKHGGKVLKAHGNYDLVQAPQEVARKLIVSIMENLGPWRIRSIEAFRDVMLGNGGVIANPLLDFSVDGKMAEEDVIAVLLNSVTAAVREGRVIDFGYVPNDVIKAESLRAHEAFEARELAMPFDSWVACSEWEGGFNAYFINADPATPNIISMTEIYGLHIPHMQGIVGPHDTYLVHDWCHMEWVNGEVRCRVLPLVEAGEEEVFHNKLFTNDHRLANMRDPLVMFLRFLNDASIPLSRVIPSEKLNRARVKAKKDPIPPHHKADLSDYITVIQGGIPKSGPKGDGKGGTHAAPIAHWRRGHDRHLRSGNTVKVRASKVNWRDPDEVHRLFYTYKPKGR